MSVPAANQGAPYLARFSRDVGFRSFLPEGSISSRSRRWQEIPALGRSASFSSALLFVSQPTHHARKGTINPSSAARRHTCSHTHRHTRPCNRRRGTRHGQSGQRPPTRREHCGHQYPDRQTLRHRHRHQRQLFDDHPHQWPVCAQDRARRLWPGDQSRAPQAHNRGACEPASRFRVDLSIPRRARHNPGDLGGKHQPDGPA